MTEYRVAVDGGKYTVVIPDAGHPHVLRYGEAWLEELPAGANCWIAMACELHEIRQQNAELLAAAKALQEDLLLRGEREDDGTIVVDCSAGRWIKFCNAIKTSEGAK